MSEDLSKPVYAVRIGGKAGKAVRNNILFSMVVLAEANGQPVGGPQVDLQLIAALRLAPSRLTDGGFLLILPSK